MIDNDLAIKLYQSIGAENEERVYEHWHASSISICPRAHYLKRLGIEGLNKPSGAKVIRWGAGHKLEEELRPHITEVWGGTISNVRLTSKELDLTGEYDNLTLDGNTLIEVKSVSDWAFYKGPLSSDKVLKQDSGEKNARGYTIYQPMENPYIHHVLQNHAYALLLGEVGTEVKSIDFVYASLSGLICVYKTEVDPRYLLWVKNRLIALNEAWRDKIPPVCICKTDSMLWGPQYQWCDYRSADAPKPPTQVEDPNCCDIKLIKEIINGTE